MLTGPCLPAQGDGELQLSPTPPSHSRPPGSTLSPLPRPNQVLLHQLKQHPEWASSANRAARLPPLEAPPGPVAPGEGRGTRARAVRRVSWAKGRGEESQEGQMDAWGSSACLDPFLLPGSLVRAVSLESLTCVTNLCD